ncbi:hypothetical protein ABT072_40015 [Streptomyces sp. NPDC002589]|uniref:hypothetical protein n=1 Tax=Streptomyces sp. NPDC002589 TaxID=3154420 RepID=UPI003319DD2F
MTGEKEGAHLVRAQLLDAAERSQLTVDLPYEDVIRTCLILGFHEEAWDEQQLMQALRWWRAVGDFLAERTGWEFTLQDLEPTWIRRLGTEDFMAVTLSQDSKGFLYEVAGLRSAVQIDESARNLTSLDQIIGE